MKTAQSNQGTFNWRRLASTDMNWKKKDEYDSKYGQHVPFSATFSGDKEPSTGNSADKEVEAFHKGEKEFKKDKNKETNPVSPIFNKRQETMKDHIKANANWRQVLGAVEFKADPDGTVKLNYTPDNAPIAEEEQTSPTEGMEQTPADTSFQSPESQSTPQSPVSTDTYGEAGVSTASAKNKKEWIIRDEISKRGARLVLAGMECDTGAGIKIFEVSKMAGRENYPAAELSKYTTRKNGHTWREVINQAQWESEYENFLKG